MIWPWTLEVYARPGVASACLALQDLDGQNVPYLLWACYGAERGASQLVLAAQIAAKWEAAATSPLRMARRALKEGVEGIDPARSEELRERIRNIELEAERLLLEALGGPDETASDREGPAYAELLARLERASLAYGRPAAHERLEALAETLTGSAPPP